MTHKTIMVKEYPSGAQQWSCLSCSYSVIVMKDEPSNYLDLGTAEDPKVDHVRMELVESSHIMELLDEIHQIWECPQCGYAVEYRGIDVVLLFDGINAVHIFFQGEKITHVEGMNTLD